IGTVHDGLADLAVEIMRKEPSGLFAHACDDRLLKQLQRRPDDVEDPVDGFHMPARGNEAVQDGINHRNDPYTPNTLTPEIADEPANFGIVEPVQYERRHIHDALSKESRR